VLAANIKPATRMPGKIAENTFLIFDGWLEKFIMVDTCGYL
jgi:hypothetical protein